MTGTFGETMLRGMLARTVAVSSWKKAVSCDNYSACRQNVRTVQFDTESANTRRYSASCHADAFDIVFVPAVQTPAKAAGLPAS